MALLTRLSKVLFNPEIFWFFLGGLIILILLSIFIYLLQSTKQARQLEDEKIKLNRYWDRQLRDSENKNAEISKTTDSLKAQLGTVGKEVSSLSKLKEELSKKEESLHNETLAKEKIMAELKNSESQLKSIKKEWESKAGEFAEIDKLKEGFKKREEELESELLSKEKLINDLKNSENRLSGPQDVRSSQEVYNGLKEQYAELERQLDASQQALALEKALHQRLEEEHKNCTKVTPA